MHQPIGQHFVLIRTGRTIWIQIRYNTVNVTHFKEQWVITMETCFNLFLCSSLEMWVFSFLRTTQLMTLVLHCLCYCLKMIIILRRIGCLSTSGWQEDFIWWWTRSWSMLEIGFDFNKIWKNCPLNKQLFFHLHSTCEADIWWRASTHPKKKLFGGKSPISTYFSNIFLKFWVSGA